MPPCIFSQGRSPCWRVWRFKGKEEGLHLDLCWEDCSHAVHLPLLPSFISMLKAWKVWRFKGRRRRGASLGPMLRRLQGLHLDLCWEDCRHAVPLPLLPPFFLSSSSSSSSSFPCWKPERYGCLKEGEGLHLDLCWEDCRHARFPYQFYYYYCFFIFKNKKY